MCVRRATTARAARRRRTRTRARWAATAPRLAFPLRRAAACALRVRFVLLVVHDQSILGAFRFVRICCGSNERIVQRALRGMCSCVCCVLLTRLARQAGHYGTAGQTNANCTGPCDAGYYCGAGSNTATEFICANGTFSHAGAAACSPCPGGDWSVAPASGCSGMPSVLLFVFELRAMV